MGCYILTVFYFMVNNVALYYIDYFVCFRYYVEKFSKIYPPKVYTELCKYKNAESQTKLTVSFKKPKLMISTFKITVSFPSFLCELVIWDLL